MAFGVEDTNLRFRIERLEALLFRALGGGGSAGFSFAGPIVANQAAASALPIAIYATAREVYTLAQEAIWQYIPGVPGTVGVPPLVADEVIVAAGGVLARTEYSSPKWRVGVNDIFIDPANVLASNENNGFTAATPLKTGYELFRRWGWNASKPIVGPNLATSVSGYTDIHAQSDIVSPDSLPIKVTALADSNGLRVIGGPSTILRTSTLTDAVTAMNPAVPLGGTRLRIRDNTLANWSAFMAPNRRVRFLNGPAAGGTLQPQTDVPAAPGGVDCSACQTTSEPTFSQVATTVTPAVGNTYVVESLVVVNLGQVDIGEELNPSYSSDVFLNIINCNLPSVGAFNTWAPKTDGATLGPWINLYQCTIDRGLDFSNSPLISIACYFSKVVLILEGGRGLFGIQGGGANGLIVGGAGTLQIATNNTTSVDAMIDGNFVVNGASIVSVIGGVRNFASWNAVPVAGVNAAGHGVQAGNGGTGPFFAMRGIVTFKGTLWGNGNPGAGLLVAAACSGVGAPQNITGTGQGDFKLANKLVGWWWNDATAVYNPAGAGIATSWANLAAAEGAAGFGGNAHELDSNSHFVATETTA